MSFFPKITRRVAYRGEARVYTYHKYKSEIAEDCVHRCVYCDCHCNSLGGGGAMELDHFRPKSEGHFPELEKEPTNLVLACRSCNGKKRDDWPAGKEVTTTHVNGSGYIDPFEAERSLYFDVSQGGGLKAKQVPGAYMIEQLSLNRPFAVAVRARRLLRSKLHQAIDDLAAELKFLDGSAPVPGELSRIADLLKNANQALRQLEIEDGPVL